MQQAAASCSNSRASWQGGLKQRHHPSSPPPPPTPLLLHPASTDPLQRRALPRRAGAYQHRSALLASHAGHPAAAGARLRGGGGGGCEGASDRLPLATATGGLRQLRHFACNMSPTCSRRGSGCTLYQYATCGADPSAAAACGGTAYTRALLPRAGPPFPSLLSCVTMCLELGWISYAGGRRRAGTGLVLGARA